MKSWVFHVNEGKSRLKNETEGSTSSTVVRLPGSYVVKLPRTTAYEAQCLFIIETGFWALSVS